MASDIWKEPLRQETLAPPHGLLFLISSNFFYIHHPTDRITHGHCYSSHGALAGIKNSSMGPP